MAESIETTKSKRMSDTLRGFLLGLALGGLVSAFWAIVLAIKFNV
jgi:tetrahydromethanopterin S-methyltransferase subunit B